MGSDWTSLPSHLLDHILSKAESQKDYLAFDCICASWHSVAATPELRSRINTLSPVPMVLVPSPKCSSHSLYNVITQRFSKSKLVVPYDGRFATFSRGWLVAVEKDLCVTLHKAYPTTSTNSYNNIVRLPPLLVDVPQYYFQFDYYVLKAVISADLLMSPLDCIVAVIYGGNRRIAFIRPHKDSSWTYLSERLEYFKDILYHDGRFYALDCFGALYSFRVVEEPFNNSADVKLVVPRFSTPIYGQLYLVEFKGKFLLVRRYLDWDITTEPKLIKRKARNRDRDCVRRKTVKVRVRELNFEKGEWVRVESLDGDVALFLGDNCSISVSCSKFSKRRSNSIYFTHDNDSLHSSDNLLEDFCKYTLKNGMKLHFGMDETTALDMFGRVPIWITPNAL